MPDLTGLARLRRRQLARYGMHYEVVGDSGTVIIRCPYRKFCNSGNLAVIRLLVKYYIEGIS